MSVFLAAGGVGDSVLRPSGFASAGTYASAGEATIANGFEAVLESFGSLDTPRAVKVVGSESTPSGAAREGEPALGASSQPAGPLEIDLVGQDGVATGGAAAPPQSRPRAGLVEPADVGIPESLVIQPLVSSTPDASVDGGVPRTPDAPLPGPAPTEGEAPGSAASGTVSRSNVSYESDAVLERGSAATVVPALPGQRTQPTAALAALPIRAEERSPFAQGPKELSVQPSPEPRDIPVRESLGHAGEKARPTRDSTKTTLPALEAQRGPLNLESVATATQPKLFPSFDSESKPFVAETAVSPVRPVSNSSREGTPPIEEHVVRRTEPAHPSTGHPSRALSGAAADRRDLPMTALSARVEPPAATHLTARAEVSPPPANVVEDQAQPRRVFTEHNTPAPSQGVSAHLAPDPSMTVGAALPLADQHPLVAQDPRFVTAPDASDHGDVADLTYHADGARLVREIPGSKPALTPTVQTGTAQPHQANAPAFQLVPQLPAIARGVRAAPDATGQSVSLPLVVGSDEPAEPVRSALGVPAKASSAHTNSGGAVAQQIGVPSSPGATTVAPGSDAIEGSSPEVGASIPLASSSTNRGLGPRRSGGFPAPPSALADGFGSIPKFSIAGSVDDADTSAETEAVDEPGYARTTMPARVELSETGLTRRVEPPVTRSRRSDASTGFSFISGMTGHSGGAGLVGPTFDAATATSGSGASPGSESGDVTDQIVKMLKMQWQDGGGEARLRLRPEHLGEVQVSLQVRNGSVTATVQAGSDVVREWIRTHQQDLKNALSEQGLSLDELVVSEEGQGRGRSDREPESAPRRRPRRPSPDVRFEVRV